MLIITYTGGGTNTGAAISTCIQQFNTSYGARPKSSGIPRIAIVVTDGRSNNPTTTISAAEMAHSEGILSYAVGVGDNVNMEELAVIATDPDSQYVRSVAEFSTSEFRSLQESLNNEACTGKISYYCKYVHIVSMCNLIKFLLAPVISDVGQVITNILQQNEVTFLQLDLPDEGMTFSLDVSQGSVVMYGSNKIQNPNEAFYDFKLSNSRPELFVNQDTFGRISKRETSNITDITIYISIQGQSVSNNFTLNTTMGDTTTEDPVPTTVPTRDTIATTDMNTGTNF